MEITGRYAVRILIWRAGTRPTSRVALDAAGLPITAGSWQEASAACRIILAELRDAAATAEPALLIP